MCNLIGSSSKGFALDIWIMLSKKFTQILFLYWTLIVLIFVVWICSCALLFELHKYLLFASVELLFVYKVCLHCLNKLFSFSLMWQLKLALKKWKGNLSKQERGVGKFSSLLAMSLLGPAWFWLPVFLFSLVYCWWVWGFNLTFFNCSGAYEPNQKEKRQKKGTTSGFLAPLPLSDALVNFLGTGENALSRADIVKKMWEYIKQNDLQVCLCSLLLVLHGSDFW